MKKVLRAIGGFFAKIGRWIANTAWIQPLLIVGGIFAIIFSIPYIKRGIENAIAANQVDTDVAFYTSRKLSLTNAEKGESQVDRLISGLYNEDYESVKKEFGEKFYLTFARESCANCKDCVNGWQELAAKWNSEEYKCSGSFKLHTVMVDTLITSGDYDGEYSAKFLWDNHDYFFDDIVSFYTEEPENYPLYKNLKSKSSSTAEGLLTSIAKLSAAQEIISDGLDIPTTFLVDLTEEGLNKEWNVYGVTQIFFNYTSLITENKNYDTVNKKTKGFFLRDSWNYSSEGLFSFDYKNN